MNEPNAPLSREHSKLQNTEAVTLPPRDIKSLLEPWHSMLSSILSLAGLIYAIGFIVVSNSLLRYGISDFSLLQARYITTGVVFVFMLTVSAYPAYYASPLLFVLLWKHLPAWLSAEPLPLVVPAQPEPSASGTNKPTVSQPPAESSANAVARPGRLSDIAAAAKRPVLTMAEQSLASEVIDVERDKLLSQWMPILWNVPLPLRPYLAWGLVVGFMLLINGGSLIIFTFLSTLPQLDPTLIAGAFWQRLWNIFVTAWPWYAVCVLFGLLSYLVIHGVPEGRRLLKIPNRFWVIVGLGLLLIWLVPLYVYQLYPRLSPILGGGKTTTVQLIAYDNADATLARLIPLDPNSGKTVEVELIDENDKVLFVLVKNPSSQQFDAIRISKDLVAGIVVTGSSP